MLLFIRTMAKLFLFVKLTEPLNLDLRNNFKLFPDIIQYNKNERDSDNRFRGCFWFYTTRFSVQLEAANVAHTAKSKLIPQICKLFSLSDYVLFYMLLCAAIQILRMRWLKNKPFATFVVARLVRIDSNKNMFYIFDTTSRIISCSIKLNSAPKRIQHRVPSRRYSLDSQFSLMKMPYEGLNMQHVKYYVKKFTWNFFLSISLKLGKLNSKVAHSKRQTSSMISASKQWPKWLVFKNCQFCTRDKIQAIFSKASQTY